MPEWFPFSTFQRREANLLHIYPPAQGGIPLELGSRFLLSRSQKNISLFGICT
jgi:hypothetical protein